MAEPDNGILVQADGGPWQRLSQVLNADPANDRRVVEAMRSLQLDAQQSKRDYVREKLESAMRRRSMKTGATATISATDSRKWTTISRGP